MVMTFSPPVTPAPKRSDGVRMPSSLKPITPCASSELPLSAVSATGTIWLFSERRSAVTTTVSIAPGDAAVSAAKAGGASKARQKVAAPHFSAAVRSIRIRFTPLRILIGAPMYGHPPGTPFLLYNSCYNN